jgi:hypothetical protein
LIWSAPGPIAPGSRGMDLNTTHEWVAVVRTDVLRIAQILQSIHQEFVLEISFRRSFVSFLKSDPADEIRKPLPHLFGVAATPQIRSSL